MKTRSSGTMVMSWCTGGTTSARGCCMEAIRYAVRVRGRPTDAVMAALPEELDVTIEPVRTVLRGRLPDQAALLGVLTRAWLLGLELIEVRRQPQPAPSLRGGEAPGRSAPPVGGL